ncbi:unnamed protein product [Caenorhabditis nigoni]
MDNWKDEKFVQIFSSRLMQSPMTCSSPLSVLRVALKGGINILYPECSINRNSPFVLKFIDLSSIFTENSQINKAVQKIECPFHDEIAEKSSHSVLLNG